MWFVDKIRSLFSSQPPDCVVQPCPITRANTGLGDDVDALAAKSPTLQKNLQKLSADRWQIKYGVAGKGSYCSKRTKEIVIDPNSKGDPQGIVQTLAHESGHALYQADPYVPPTGLTRQQYIDMNTKSALKDEGEATMMNCQIRKEIRNNGGPDIGVAGTQAADYAKVYDKYSASADRAKGRQEIGALFADGEHPSTDPSKTYRQYYEQPYADFFDQQGTGP